MQQHSAATAASPACLPASYTSLLLINPSLHAHTHVPPRLRNILEPFSTFLSRMFLELMKLPRKLLEGFSFYTLPGADCITIA